MSVNREEVRRIAELARLRLDDATVDRITRELNGILDHMETLDQVDASGVVEPVRLPDEPVAFRDPELLPDPLEEGAPGDRAPDWREGFFLVPRLPALEGDEVEAEAGREGDGS